MMSSYSILKRGDRLPTVGVLQLLLNRAGNSLKVDGVFGPRTQAAMTGFQRKRKLPHTGATDKQTWDRLFHEDRLPLIDLVDVFHDSYNGRENPPNIGLYEAQAREIVNSGGSPIYLGGMSNGLVQMGEQLRGASQILLLRIVGHGGPGVQAISMGKGGWIEPVGRRDVRHLFPHQTTSINMGNIMMLPPSLRGIFGPWGSLELHGCHVAQGIKGRDFVRKLADTVGVPVTAGTGSQESGMRFLGPTYTAVPGEGTLERWCAGLPQFTPITVP
jgi:hypothetical protein